MKMFEKVNPAHPDKVADRIAGAIVDAAYRKEGNPRIAVEVLIGHGVCHIIAESSVHIPMYEVETIVTARKYIEGLGGFEKLAEPQAGMRQLHESGYLRNAHAGEESEPGGYRSPIQRQLRRDCREDQK